MNNITINIGNGVQFKVNESSGVVTTIYPDGFSGTGTRERNAQNQAEVQDQGYGARGLWRSLIDHELLHTFVSRRVFHKESPTLRHEAGADRALYVLRLHEETMVLSMQHWLNTDDPQVEVKQLSPNDRHEIKCELLGALDKLTEVY